MHVRSAITLPTKFIVDGNGENRKKLGQAVWAYLFLHAAVGSSTGERLVNPAEMGEVIGVGEETVRTWLGQLRKAGFVNTSREGRHIWVRLANWERAENPRMAQGRYDVEADVALPPDFTKRLAKGLGEPEASPEVREIVEQYPRSLIESALAHVVAVPQHRIRKSRLALLVYLLKRQTN